MAVRLNPASPARKGEELELWLDARTILLFDPETGLSLRRPPKEEAKQEVAAATPRPAGTPGTAADLPANPPEAQAMGTGPPAAAQEAPPAAPSRPAGAPSD